MSTVHLATNTSRGMTLSVHQKTAGKEFCFVNFSPMRHGYKKLYTMTQDEKTQIYDLTDFWGNNFGRLWLHPKKNAFNIGTIEARTHSVSLEKGYIAQKDQFLSSLFKQVIGIEWQVVDPISYYGGVGVFCSVGISALTFFTETSDDTAAAQAVTKAASDAKASVEKFEKKEAKLRETVTDYGNKVKAAKKAEKKIRLAAKKVEGFIAPESGVPVTEVVTGLIQHMEQQQSTLVGQLERSGAEMEQIAEGEAELAGELREMRSNQSAIRARTADLYETAGEIMDTSKSIGDRKVKRKVWRLANKVKTTTSALSDLTG